MIECIKNLIFPIEILKFLKTCMKIKTINIRHKDCTMLKKTYEKSIFRLKVSHSTIYYIHWSL